MAERRKRMTLEQMSDVVFRLAHSIRLRDSSEAERAFIQIDANDAADLRDIAQTLFIFDHWGATELVKREMQRWVKSNNRRRLKNGLRPGTLAPGQTDLPSDEDVELVA